MSTIPDPHSGFHPHSDAGHPDTTGAPGPDSVEHRQHRPVLVGSIVWGGIVVALCALMIILRQAPLALDLGQAMIWLLLAAGVALMAGGAGTLLRRR